jgi:PAS domain S-box-containing protein
MSVGRIDQMPQPGRIRASRSRELVPLLRRILAAATETLGATRGTIHLTRPTDGGLRLAAQIGFSPSGLEPFALLDPESAPWRAVLEHGVRLIIDDIARDTRLEQPVRAALGRMRVHSLLSLPLLGQKNEPLGLLSIYRAPSVRPAKHLLEMLDVCRIQAEQAIEGARSSDALNRNEAGLQLALEAGKMGTFEWNIQTNEIKWSDNLEAIHGLAPGTFDGTFASFQSLIHSDDRAGVMENIRRSVETGADYEAEFRSASPDGSTRWLLGKGMVLRDEHGGAWRMMGICMDITARKRAEEELRESDRRKDEFLAMVSHELRNPLFAIANAASVLDSIGTPHPIADKARGMIRRQTELLTRIVNDLLDIARLTAGKLVLQQTRLDLGMLVERRVAELASNHVLDRHVYDVHAAPVLIHGDGTRLEQVVTHLVTNAVKYTPPGGLVTVEVETALDQAVLRVRDTGVGIALDLLPRIFDRFVQSERGLDRRDGGMGIGLAIVRQLVEAHGGRVEARSDGPDQGTEITVWLPLVQRVAAHASAGRDGAQSPNRQRILVIDDNNDARQALVVLLEMAGHELHEAADGLTGLASVSRLQPDIVFADIGLPGIDGFELARRIRANQHYPRLVALTGYDHPEQRRRGAEAGFDAYLVKPVEVEALLRELPGA